MPKFDTPEPISATISLAIGDTRISASDRADTVVEVRPTDPANQQDVKFAQQTRVEYANGKLLVKTPQPIGLFSKPGSVDITVELPAGSGVHGEAGLADFRAEGRLGECRFKTGAGRILLGRTGAAKLTTGSGTVTADATAGHTTVVTGSGDVRIGSVDGTAVIKNSNGDSWVGEVTGDIRFSTANGDITVDRAAGSVRARTANGSVRLGSVVRGSIELDASTGELEVGIAEGTAAWLELSTMTGRVHNTLGAAEGPRQTDERVEVRARAITGDIVIRRA